VDGVEQRAVEVERDRADFERRAHFTCASSARMRAIVAT
jgi:hypothetical protein